jgi:hypothetical protein
MMLNHRLNKSPGRRREGEIFVVREQTGQRVYEGPEATLIPDLGRNTRDYYDLLGSARTSSSCARS